MLVCQITRGVCPARSIVQVMSMTQASGWAYRLIEGLPIAEAKETAVDCALASEQDLLLCEDDISVPMAIWQAVAQAIPQEVVYAKCRMRNRLENVYRSPGGTFLWTGNVFTRIPSPILARLPRPVFEARTWHPTSDRCEVVPGGSSERGTGSDVGFWWKVRHLDPPVMIRELGSITHLRHPLNERRYEGVCVIGEW